MHPLRARCRNVDEFDAFCGRRCFLHLLKVLLEAGDGCPASFHNAEESLKRSLHNVTAPLHSTRVLGGQALKAFRAWPPKRWGGGVMSSPIMYVPSIRERDAIVCQSSSMYKQGRL
jgi:hypothetical protein